MKTKSKERPERTPAQIESSKQNLTPGRQEALEPYRRWQAEVRARTSQIVLDEIATNPVPLHARDLAQILAKQYGEDTKEVLTNESTITGILRELCDGGKLVRRLETVPERLIRGGGEMPPAKGKMLYATAPGPVPERTRLPIGIEPVKSMAQHQNEKKARREQVDEWIMQATKGDSRVRSKGQISRAIGVDEKETAEGLDRLVRRGLLRFAESSYQWFPTDRGPGGRPTHRPKPEPRAKAKTKTATPENQPASPVASPDVEEVVSMVRALAARSGDNGELEQVKRANAALQEEVTKLRKQVAGLKAAIAAME